MAGIGVLADIVENILRPNALVIEMWNSTDWNIQLLQDSWGGIDI